MEFEIFELRTSIMVFFGLGLRVWSLGFRILYWDFEFGDLGLEFGSLGIFV